MATVVNDWKRAAQKQWNTTPCGEVDGDKASLEYFLSVERNRYEDYAPWMRDQYRYDEYQGQKVLEIGFGQGTDLCQFAKAGADCYGVDITENHYNLARENLGQRGLTAQLFLEDASELHFESESFDAVYSFGVLHHTPDTIRCISEAFRVLKPGGELILTFYHKHSVYHWFAIMFLSGILHGRLRKLGHDGLLSTIEEGADGIEIKPLVKVYSRRDMRTILADFSEVSLDIRHLDHTHFSSFGRFIPNWLLKALERQLGWYVIAKAIK